MANWINALNELENAKGLNAKKQVLTHYKDNNEFINYLKLLFDSHVTFGIGKKSLVYAVKHPEEYPAYNWKSFIDMCEHVSTLKSVNDYELREIGAYLLSIDDIECIWVEKLLCKCARLGVTARTINKVIPDLIPEWGVQQAYKYENGCIPSGTEFWLTQKLNGVRATYINGKLYARSGEEYKGLGSILSTLDTLSKLYNGLVFDGELTLNQKHSLVNLSDNEAFRTATGIINSDSDDKDGKIKFTIFDCLSEKEFNSTPVKPYSERRYFMNELAILMGDTVEDVEILPVLYHGTDQSKIDILLDKMVKEDKEGLMLNLDVPYQKKRHNGILKIKRFYTMDLKIVDVEEGAGKNENKLGAICVDFKGNIVKVGSGFADYERELMWENRDELTGKFAEVKYKEISKNKQNNLESLQFPVFVRLREDRNSPSYN